MFRWLKNLFSKALLGGRSGGWGRFKKEYERKHPKECEICGDKKVDLHHIEPFHINPSRELDETNVCWLCNGCYS